MSLLCPSTDIDLTKELPLCSLKYLCILKLIHKGYGKDYSRYGIEKSKVIIC